MAREEERSIEELTAIAQEHGRIFAMVQIKDYTDELIPTMVEYDSSTPGTVAIQMHGYNGEKVITLLFRWEDFIELMKDIQDKI